MRPGVLLAIVFAALALLAIALSGAIGWALMRGGFGAEDQPLMLFNAAGLIAFLFALTVAWAILCSRLVRPLRAVTREIETLSHAPSARPIEVPEHHATGGLVDALHDLITKFIAARQERDEAVRAATERGESYKRRLETILLDLGEGVIVCNLDHRILLYNQAAMQILKRPVALGLGRRLFGLFERGPILEAVDDLIARQQADRTRKLTARRRLVCPRRGGGKSMEARLALVCSDEVEAEGYVLTFAGGGEAEAPEEALPPRPEFYDFDLFKRQPAREATETPLKELRCVVFDTETTGLRPSQGDQLVSVGAVCVVNGRLVSGETFQRLINPGRKIPQASIRFHGITDEMVADMPPAADVLRAFHAFVGRAVLVAHNAAFDMKFIELKEKQAGVSFHNPVLDVLLLSAFLHDHATDHSLAATARRFGVMVTDRHSALGDSMTTAEIFLAMLDPLAQRGVETLGQALDASSKMVKLRKQQAQF